MFQRRILDWDSGPLPFDQSPPPPPPQVHVVYESILDWDSFSVRIREHSLEDIPTILKSIPEEQVRGSR